MLTRQRRKSETWLVSFRRTQCIDIARTPEQVFAYLGRWDFEASPVGTRLTFTPIARLTGVRRRLEPLMILATLAVFRRFHRRLKRALEAG
jgi:hypothetical protein